MLGGDGSGHRRLALSALVVVLTICTPAVRGASTGTQQPRCTKDEGYQLPQVLDDLRCILSLLCGFCGMHLLHVMQQGLVQRVADERSLEVAQDPENQDVKLCFAVSM